MKNKIHFTLLFASLLTFNYSANAEDIIKIEANRGGYIASDLDGSNARYISPVDTQVNFIGALGDEGARQVIIGFDLPKRLKGRLKNATVYITMRKEDAASSFPWFNVDAYGFTTDPSEKDLYIGDNDKDRSKTLLGDNIITNKTADNAIIEIDVKPMLDDIYKSGTSNAKTLFIRLNPDDPDGDLSTGDISKAGARNFGRYRPIIVKSGDQSNVILEIVTD